MANKGHPALMQSCWTIWVDAKSEPKALKLFDRFRAWLGCELGNPTLAPYPKTGGYALTFEITLEGETWNDQVVEVIALGQRAAYGWLLSGDVHAGIAGWSNQAKVGGIVSVQWILQRA